MRSALAPALVVLAVSGVCLAAGADAGEALAPGVFRKAMPDGGSRLWKSAPDGGSPVLLGSLPKEEIRQVIHEHRNDIRKCYEDRLSEKPISETKLTAVFTIAQDGTVSSANVQESDPANAGLAACVVGAVRTWQFPKPNGGGVVLVTYPFVFKRGP